MVRLRIVMLILCLVISPAIASQYVAATTTRVELTSYIDSSESIVTVVAEIAAPKKTGALESLIVRYGNAEIKIPRNILNFVLDPVLASLELFYCGRGAVILVDEDGNEVARLDASDEPCLAVKMSFSNELCLENPDCKLPYISVQISEGEIKGFGVWQFDGVDYVVQFNDELGIYGPF